MRVFVDREELRKQFPAKYGTYLHNRKNYKTAQVLYYYGDGGVGKSTLLEEFEKKLGSTDCIIKKFDFDIKDLKNPISFLVAVRQSFSTEFDFPLFDYAYLIYTRRAYIEPDKRMLDIKPFHELLDLALSVAQKDIIDIWEHIGNIYSHLKQKTDLTRYGFDVDDIKSDSAKRIEQNLARYLAKDIEYNILDKTPERGVIIFLDTFEQVISYSKNYIGNELIHAILDVDDGLISNTPLVLYVIASREPCKIGCLSNVQLNLNGLDIWAEKDAVEFIKKNSQIEDESFCKQLAKGCGYYPFYLNLALDHIERSLYGKYQQMDIEALNLNKMLEMFLKGLEENYIYSLVVLACQNDWDTLTYNKVVEKLNFPTVPLELIESYSFIKSVPQSKNRIALHQIMRDCINKHEDLTFSLIQRATHTTLRELSDFKSLPIETIIRESFGESDLLNQYVQHSIWLIKDKSSTEERNTGYLELFSEIDQLSKQLRERGSAKILISPLERLSDFAIYLYGENSKQYIDCRYKMTFIHTYSGNLGAAEAEDRIVYNAYKDKFESELAKLSIKQKDLHSLRDLENHLVESLNSLCYDMCRNGKYQEAIEKGIECCDCANTIWGEDDIKSFPSQSNLAYYYSKNHNSAQAISLTEEVLSRRENLLRRISTQVIISKRNLAVQYKNTDLEKALHFMEEAYLGFQDIYGELHGYTLESRQYLANFLVRKNEYDLAIDHLTKILEIRKKLDGEFHPNVIDCLTYLSLAYFEKSNAEEKNGDKPHLKSSIDYISRANSLAVSIFPNTDSDWKICMYKEVSEKIQKGSSVDEILDTLDNYKPSTT